MSEKRKYRQFTPEQKAEIVLAGLRGDRSVRGQSCGSAKRVRRENVRHSRTATAALEEASMPQVSGADAASGAASSAGRPSGGVERLLAFQSRRGLGPLARQAALLLGVDIPPSVVIGEDFRLQHRGRGVVLHPRTTIGDRVRIFHNVTVGRSEPHSLEPDDAVERFVIEDDVWLCAGAVVLGSRGVVRVGRGSIIGANSVLVGSTGEDEVWSGVPARKIGERAEPRRNYR